MKYEISLRAVIKSLSHKSYMKEAKKELEEKLAKLHIERTGLIKHATIPIRRDETIFSECTYLGDYPMVRKAYSREIKDSLEDLDRLILELQEEIALYE